jgi:hypothetical protein
MKTLALLFALVIVSFGITIVSEAGVTRTITVEQSPPLTPHTFEVRAVRSDKMGVDAIDVLFSTSWVPRFVHRYFQRSSDASQLFASRWNMWKLIEYIENGTSDGFVPFSGDVILQNYTLYLKNANWSTMTLSTYAVGAATVHEVCTQLPAVNPVIIICGKLANQKIFDGAITLNPSRFKFSITITNNFPYMSMNSRIALMVSWDTFDSITDFTPAEDSGLDNQTHGVILYQDSKLIGLSTYINMINETCSTGSSQVPVYRTIIYQDSTTLTTEQLPPGDPDANIDVSTRISFFSFLTDCPQPMIVWDPDIGTNGAASLAPLLMILMLLAYLF